MAKYFFPFMFGMVILGLIGLIFAKVGIAYEGKRVYKEWKLKKRVYIYSQNQLNSIQTAYVTQDIKKDARELSANYDSLAWDKGLRIAYLPYVPIDSTLNAFLIDSVDTNFWSVGLVDTVCWGYGVVYAHKNVLHEHFVNDTILAKSRAKARRSPNYAPSKDCAYNDLNYFLPCCYFK